MTFDVELSSINEISFIESQSVRMKGRKNDTHRS